MLDTLAKDLKQRFGKGFSKSNVYLMRQFYLKYPIFQTLSGKLSWSHYAELLGVSDDTAREFYLNGISNNIFVSKYQLYLPDKKELENKVKELINE